MIFSVLDFEGLCIQFYFRHPMLFHNHKWDNFTERFIDMFLVNYTHTYVCASKIKYFKTF